MNSNEEYLDNLLKSMGGDEPKKAEPSPADNKVLSADEIAAMFAAIDDNANNSTQDTATKEVAEEEEFDIFSQLTFTDDVASVGDLLASDERFAIDETVSIDDVLADIPEEESVVPPIEEVIEEPIAEQIAVDEEEDVISDALLDELLGAGKTDMSSDMSGGSLLDDILADLSEDNFGNLSFDEDEIEEEEPEEESEEDYVLRELDQILGLQELSDLPEIDRTEDDFTSTNEESDVFEANDTLKTDDVFGLGNTFGLDDTFGTGDALQTGSELETDSLFGEGGLFATHSADELSQIPGISFDDDATLLDGLDKFAEEDTPKTQDDLIALLEGFGGDEELSEIGMLLQQSGETDYVPVDDDVMPTAQELLGEKKAKKKREKKIKENREKKSKEDAFSEKPVKEKRRKKKKDYDVEDFLDREYAKEKKPSWFARLLAFLTAEEEEEESPKDNIAIIQELDVEDAEMIKEKKVKKGKMPLGKKKSGGKEDEAGEEGGKGKAKKAKPEKKKKPKVEKVKKIVPLEEPTRPMSKKSISVILLFAATVFAIVILSVNLIAELIRKNDAKEAFAKQDYLTYYEIMYGTDMTESEKIMFKHAEVVLKMERRLSVYNGYKEKYMELEALDSLMRAMAGYEELYGDATECGATSEVAALYDLILVILKNEYGLTQEDAMIIAQCSSNVEYTRYLTAVVEGKKVSTDSNSDIRLPEDEPEDLLPEEEEFIQ